MKKQFSMKGIGYFVDLKVEGIGRGREGFEFEAKKEEEEEEEERGRRVWG